MSKTIGIACAEYEKCVVATTQDATRIHDRIGLVARAIECTYARTRRTHPARRSRSSLLCPHEIRNGKKTK